MGFFSSYCGLKEYFPWTALIPADGCCCWPQRGCGRVPWLHLQRWWGWAILWRMEVINYRCFIYWKTFLWSWIPPSLCQGLCAPIPRAAVQVEQSSSYTVLGWPGRAPTWAVQKPSWGTAAYCVTLTRLFARPSSLHLCVHFSKAAAHSALWYQFPMWAFCAVYLLDKSQVAGVEEY